MKGDFHVRFCEKFEVKFLLLTRLRGRRLITASYSILCGNKDTACYNGDTPKKGGRPPYAAAHTQATMGGNRTDEALLELSTLVLANCQPALPLRRSICAG